jgi:polyhydroxyalkanoate synthesis regulator phasin
MGSPFQGLVQKAFYLGMGLASLAGEKAGSTLAELRIQATKLAEELVERGEMTTEEARRFVDDLMGQQKPMVDQTQTPPKAPRTIAIEDEESPAAAEDDHSVAAMRRRVAELQEELRRMQS